MIKTFSKTAKLERLVLSDNNSLTASDIRGEYFRAWETELPRKSQVTLLAGIVADDYSLTLRTTDRIGETIQADDTIIWDNVPRSVQSVQAVRSNVRLGAKEYIIGLK